MWYNEVLNTAKHAPARNKDALLSYRPELEAHNYDPILP